MPRIYNYISDVINISKVYIFAAIMQLLFMANVMLLPTLHLCTYYDYNYYKIFQIIIHEHVSRHLKSKFSPHQHGFIKYDITITNLVVYLDLTYLLVHSHFQIDAIHFAFSKTLDIVLHVLPLPKLYYFGLSPGSTVTWPTDCPISATVAHFRHRMKCYPLCHKDHFWDHFFSLFS
jgi:hypothetical protein